MRRKNVVILIIFALFVVLGAGGILVKQMRKPLPYEFAVAKIQNIIQEVNVTGKVKAAETVDLSFEKSGKIIQVYVDTGQNIEKDKPLAVLDSSELRAQLAQAKAQLEIQQIRLEEIKKGARAEEINVLQTKIDNAQRALVDSQVNLANAQSKAITDLANYYDDVPDILNSAYALSDDAVNKQISDLFSNALTDSPQITFQISDSQVEIAAEQQRVIAGVTLNELKAILKNTSPNDYTSQDKALNDSEQKLIIIRDFLSKVAEALNFSTNLSATTLAAYKGYANTGRTNVITAIAEINTQKQAITSQKSLNQQNISTAQAQLTTAQNSLTAAQKDLDLKKAAATPEQIQTQEAQIKSAQADIENLEIQISKTTLRSPINGIVIKQNAKVGQIATANTNIVSIISEVKFQVEANIAEADIAKVKIGQTAKITLDGYGPETVFEAMVIKIDPAETIIEGVATYKTTFEFNEDSDKIKSGMTANIDILTAQKENVLTIPSRAVITKNNDKLIRVFNGEKIEERKITLGLKGSDGNVEIIEGLQEGEKVITFEKK
ncbi:hypothetical protein COT20_01145 [bacterium (Candidatus Gribaldobacteria) CG08_land_8_20_14_0_20_39_15]|uniref:Multidrug resistance protein MdtA-like C-terminal permuted SH3 domain-containing protein n=1 Tax=bacterium (Candidatus Gribaldobacteria) CG08_land_8_20_14_0_20_39_15 TaxID=2014273 RepID=A0A2M6XUZ2_9BACT|nr:MAG: hypothetical protein COT20_01145 [bacterium (Candidatus Gribaldobacteria) CG08_land_8_20_14_0_20_39_15]